MPGMSKIGLFLLVVAIVGLGFAFLYQPRSQGSRFRQLGYRIRTVAYAYVLAVLISAALRLLFQWGA